MGFFCQTNGEWTVSMVRPFLRHFSDHREDNNHTTVLLGAAGVVGAQAGCIQMEYLLRETSGLTFFRMDFSTKNAEMLVLQ